MVPVEALQSLPVCRLANGKLDRKAPPLPDSDAAREACAAKSATEIAAVAARFPPAGLRD